MQAKCWDQRTGITAVRVLVDYAGALESVRACRGSRAGTNCRDYNRRSQAIALMAADRRLL
jgi:hypothetical protein